MTFFEFLMVLVGLVGAIAISVILSYLGHITRNWQFVKNPVLFLLLTTWMLLNLIGHLAGIWAYRFVDMENHGIIFVVVAPVIFFTLAATTLIPSTSIDHREIDLDSVYFHSSRSVYFFLAIHEAAALAADYLPGVVNAPSPWFMLAMVLILLFGMTTKNKLVHYLLLLLIIASQAIPSGIAVA